MLQQNYNQNISGINLSLIDNSSKGKMILPLTIPVIAIDGPSGSGKGTIAKMLASHFNFNCKATGNIYRTIAYIIKNKNIPNTDLETITQIGASLPPIFNEDRIVYEGIDITEIISLEEYGKLASTFSSHSPLRDALLSLERSFATLPGLVIEGRDMTTRVFKDVSVKIFLDASPEARAKRRFLDEETKGKNPNLDDLIKLMRERDESDRNRTHGALKIAEDALYVDTTSLTREEVLQKCIEYAESKLK